MDRLLGKKSKKPQKYSQRDIFPGILTNTAVGPLGFRTQLDIAPKGEQNRSHQNLDIDWTDPTVAPDEESGGVSRIVFQGKTDGIQEPPAPETPIPGAVDIDDTDHGHDQSSERFHPCYLDWRSRESQCLSAPAEEAPDTGDGEVEPSGPLSRTCRYRFRVGFLLTHTSC